MECKKISLYWGKGEKGSLESLLPAFLLELKVVVQWAQGFARQDSIPFCLLSSGFSTGVYCRALCPYMACCQHHFIWYLRPNRCLISRGLPSLLISVTSLELTFLLRWRSKRPECLQQKNLWLGWRRCSQQCQRQCQRLGKREVLQPAQVLWKKVTSHVPWTLDSQF